MRLEWFVSFFGNVFACVFECVGERSVSDVMEQCGKDGCVGAKLIKFTADVAYGDFATDSLDEFAGAVKDSNGMGEARVCRRRKHELDLSELGNAPQPLEIGGLEKPPGGFLGADFRVEVDDSVYSVLDSLISCHRGACCCINRREYHMKALDETTREKLEAAAFRRLLGHLQKRTDVQNIDLMILAGFCRNCLADWYREAAETEGVEMSKDDARLDVYGMAFAEWKRRYQSEATEEQKRAFAEASARHDSKSF